MKSCLSLKPNIIFFNSQEADSQHKEEIEASSRTDLPSGSSTDRRPSGFPLCPCTVWPCTLPSKGPSSQCHTWTSPGQTLQCWCQEADLRRGDKEVNAGRWDQTKKNSVARHQSLIRSCNTNLTHRRLCFYCHQCRTILQEEKNDQFSQVNENKCFFGESGVENQTCFKFPLLPFLLELLRWGFLLAGVHFLDAISWFLLFWRLLVSFRGCSIFAALCSSIVRSLATFLCETIIGLIGCKEVLRYLEKLKKPAS